MKKFILFSMVAILAFADTAWSSSAKRYFQDAKWPTQASVEHQLFTDPVAADTNYILSAHAGNTSAAAVSVTTGLTSPDMPRNVVITPGNTTGVNNCTVTVTGTDIAGNSITEDIVFGSGNSTGSTGGVKAFKTVSQVDFPASCENANWTANWSIGVGESLGVAHCMKQAGDILFSVAAGAKEGTAPTMTANATALSGNTANFNGTMNGSNDFDLYYFQNFRCQ